jgi:hypothetical protein
MKIYTYWAEDLRWRQFHCPCVAASGRNEMGRNLLLEPGTRHGSHTMTGPGQCGDLTMISKSGTPNLAYILGRIKDILHPPVHVTPLPAGIRVEKDVKVPCAMACI